MNINVSEIYQEELKKLEEEDFIRKQIRLGLEKTLGETVKEAFTSYKFKNVISEKLGAITNEVVKDIGFETYSNYIKQNLIEQIALVQHNTLGSLVYEASKEFFESPKEFSLHDLIEKFIEENKNGDGEGYGEYMTVFINKDHIFESSRGKGGTVYIYLDQEENVNKYSCKYQIQIDVESNKIEEISIDSNKLNGRVIIGRVYDKFESLLYKLYYNETPITGVLETDSDDFNAQRCEGDY